MSIDGTRESSIAMPDIAGRIGCPVCTSPYTAYVRQVPTRRTKQMIPLYACLKCRSFWNPSGYDQSCPPKEKVINWHTSVAERNITAGRALFTALDDRGVRPSAVLEIGCGSGSVLFAAKERGMKTAGFDLNPHAVELGREQYGLDLRAEAWTANTYTDFDLLLCISVLEHLDQPRTLLSEIAAACKRRGAAAYISVPTLDAPRWKYLLDPSPALKGSPFFDNDVHVVHFSSEGMLMALKALGAHSITRVSANIWNGFLAQF